ncbi:hypothetical protein Tco_0941197 [Tanacetum coccineum]|uniref:Uncharacterized protein n=1 Tax=Tanacetum coccineum TaxID=301880 RepID=A0ABQ5DQS6_9ASTR
MGCMIRAKLEVNTARLKKLVLLAKVSAASRLCLRHHLQLSTLPSTPTLSQAESSREPMRRYLMEYISLEDEHVFLVEEQPLPPVDSPTAESPGYVVESDPKEDPEEYEDDETENGPINYPMDEGDDGDDDDGDSSRDNANDEEEEEHPAPADSVVVIATVELVSPPEGTKPVIPPPSTDISTTGARITVRF